MSNILSKLEHPWVQEGRRISCADGEVALCTNEEWARAAACAPEALSLLWEIDQQIRGGQTIERDGPYPKAILALLNKAGLQ